MTRNGSWIFYSKVTSHARHREVAGRGLLTIRLEAASSRVRLEGLPPYGTYGRLRWRCYMTHSLAGADA